MNDNPQNKPLYALRAEREFACRELILLLSTYVDEEELRQALDDFCCCNEQATLARWWIEDTIRQLEPRSAATLLEIWADLVDAVRGVSETERREVAELIACAGAAKNSIL